MTRHQNPDPNGHGSDEEDAEMMLDVPADPDIPQTPPTADGEGAVEALRYEGSDYYHVLLPDGRLACESRRDGSESVVVPIDETGALVEMCPKCALRYDPHAGLTDTDYRERIAAACDLPESNDLRRFTVAQLKALARAVGADGGAGE